MAEPELPEQGNAEVRAEMSPGVRERIWNHAKLMWGTCVQGLFSGPGLFYLVLVVGFGGWASYYLPTINGSEKSPETLGVYVIGLLVTLFAEALFTWKKGHADRVAETVMVLSALLGVFAVFFSSKVSFAGGGSHASQRDWNPYAQPVLILVFALTILLWLALNAVDPKLSNPVTTVAPSAASLDK